MTQLATGWNLEVDRGPDWLFLRVQHDGETDSHDVPLAEAAWSAMQQHFAHRIVLEMHDVPLINSYLVGQLVLLHKRVTSSGGVLRLSGLNRTNERVLQIARLADRFPNFPDRDGAVRGCLPNKPR